tara:strand:- start:3791 stop:4156 length:366 start_codon:yes stop_codon:yes gene_type:complete
MNLKTIANVIKKLHDIDIFQQTRKREVVEMRCVANKYMSEVAKKRLVDIVKEYELNGFKTSHCSIIHSINTYKQNNKYNTNILLTYRLLLGDSKIQILQKLPDATEDQIDKIATILETSEV